MTSEMNYKTWQTIQVNDHAQELFLISEEKVLQFANVTGDHNPIHLDKEFAKKTVFRKPVVHGALQSSLISGLLAEKMPGRGSIYANQTLTFKAPLFVGESVLVSVTVIEKLDASKQVRIKTVCEKEDGTITLEGEAIVYPARR